MHVYVTTTVVASFWNKMMGTVIKLVLLFLVKQRKHSK